MSIEHIRALKEAAKLPKPRKVYQIPRKSAKRIAMEKLEQKVEIVKPKKAGWFDAERIKEIADSTGVVYATDKDTALQPKGSSELQRWFEDRRKEMTGICDNCGGKTCKDDDKYYKFSLAHLLPKAYVKSVATHSSNWLELCHFGNGCHHAMDSKMLDLIDMNCFDKIVQRVTEMYPSIAPNERRRIPPILLEYIKTEL